MNKNLKNVAPVIRKPLIGVDVSKTSRLAKYWIGKSSRVEYRYNSKGFVNGPNYRNQYQLVTDYNLAGLEFGRYVTQGEREERFAGLAEALYLFSSPLFFNSKNLGFDNNLLLSIGARGQGGRALAHFEPAYSGNIMAINTTKENGNHSFAHEYLHAVDFFLGYRYDVTSMGSYLSQYNNGSLLRKTVADIVDACSKQMNLKGYDEYWHRPIEIFARSFETWVAWVLSQSSDKSYRNSFLCKTIEEYQSSPVYPHTFTKDLDNKFIIFCTLAGRAMNGVALENLLVAAAKNDKKTTKKTTKESQVQKNSYVIKDYAKVDKLLNDVGLKCVDALTIKKNKISGTLKYYLLVTKAESIIDQCSPALVRKIIKTWKEKQAERRHYTNEEFVLKSDYVINELVEIMKKYSK